ncbi:tRNA-guanine transglycosylase DpdA [Micromonospora rubida]|uniref:tRNA-guanine transglycosylase DpdA n=1 Tax=Micromonospora rubida TaxID=2697657 RepID=UPI001377FC9F|nr:tRNA-guanine transglycosylase DpdA [Micromonospora rubida]NBE85428.1 queuine/other tRNA-ribosyltransferase [Micromonospora rubida]
MKYFFPDSQDQIDPGFDFVTEERDPMRVRQRDDLYAHEVFDPPPFHGLLVAKSIVDGYSSGAGGKYTGAQRNRLRREGARRFFRLDHVHGPLDIMGDCGAFTYHQLPEPPFTVDEVIEFYGSNDFDYGISVDHIVFNMKPLVPVDPNSETVRGWAARQELTLTLANEFWQKCKDRQVRFQPLGVAQGWSPGSYAESVAALQRMGYRRIAMGGMVPYKTPEILACLAAVDEVRDPSTQLHLLGISRCDNVPAFAGHGVTSFDSTSPFLQSFKDDRDNYYTPGSTYVAIRVKQVEGNAPLRKRIAAGEIDQRRAIQLERAALRLLREYDAGLAAVDDTVAAVHEYSALIDPHVDRRADYQRTLQDMPWRDCNCPLCCNEGIEIAVFRGTERNKRRGFHNLYVFRNRLRAQLGEDPT